MINRMTTQPKAQTVIVGVDTHKQVHVAVAIATCGMRLGAPRSSPMLVAIRRYSRGPRPTGRSRRSASKAPAGMAWAWPVRFARRVTVSWK